jgi:hypothetical protein
MVDSRFDPDKLASEEIAVDKWDAARRQLETAITLFFNDGNVVSQHTLVMAAHGILYDLAQKRKTGGSIKDSSRVPAHRRNAFIKALHLHRTHRFSSFLRARRTR